MKTIKLFALAAILGVGTFQLAPVAANVADTIDECSKELLIAYFPEVFVKETLKKFNVPQSSWAAITQELNGKESEIIKMVEEKAEKMKENPLKDPKQRQEAVKIFRETLLQVFSGVMKKNGVTDDKQIQSMLDDIQQQKAKRFAQCMEKHKNQAKHQPQAPAAAPAGAPAGAPKAASGMPQGKLADDDRNASGSIGTSSGIRDSSQINQGQQQQGSSQGQLWSRNNDNQYDDDEDDDNADNFDEEDLDDYEDDSY